MNCIDCFFCKTNGKKCWCEGTGWALKEYSLRTLEENRNPMFDRLPKRCPDWSPPEREIVYKKNKLNRIKIGRILEAVRDNQRFWDYGLKTNIKGSYWGDWE